MIRGVRAILYSKDAGRLRASFRGVLGFPAVDAGHGWRTFALPPAGLGGHPAEGEGHHELYLMCDDVEATVAAPAGQGVACSPVVDQGWGFLTEVSRPDGATMGLYQPRHPSAIGPGA